MKKVALIGNPNCGKSSIFNLLTGLRQKTGNYPGITVDIKYANLKLPNGEIIQITDFPGCYNLYPTSHDEKVVAEVLCDPTHKYFPDAIVVVVDSTALNRHLVLMHQLKDLGIPILLCFNMTDLSQEKGLKIDFKAIADAFGVKYFTMNARAATGGKDLIHEIQTLLNLPSVQITGLNFESSVDSLLLNQVKASTNFLSDFQALMNVHHMPLLKSSNPDRYNKLRSLITQNSQTLLKWETEEILDRCRQVESIVYRNVVTPPVMHEGRTYKADKYLAHPIIGPIIFFGIIGLIFQGIFSWAEYPMNFIDNSIASLNQYLRQILPVFWLSDLITDGIIAGLGGVLVFIPQITILFLAIGFLEEMGYMSRAAYLFDRIMARFGLNGRSIVALISGAACAIPAIMSTRTITNWKERLITIMVTPLISCSARLPVFAVLIAFVVPSYSVFGFLTSQGLVLLALYILGVLAALVSAYVFKKVLKSDQPSYLLMELPEYKWPNWKNVLMEVWLKIGTFIREAGKIIILISIILWFLASYGPGNSVQEAANPKNFPQLNHEDLDNSIAAAKLENSYAGRVGKFLEPLIQPLGFDWKIGIALVTSFAAREVFVGTMSTIYSVGKEGDPATVRERMSQEVNPLTGKKVFNAATSSSLLIFYLFAMQCMSTIAVVKRETGGWKWPLIQLLFMSVLAYGSSWIVFNLVSYFVA